MLPDDSELIGTLELAFEGNEELSERVCRRLGIGLVDCTEDEDHAFIWLPGDDEWLDVGRSRISRERFRATVRNDDGLVFTSVAHTQALATCAAIVRLRAFQRWLMSVMHPGGGFDDAQPLVKRRG